MGLREPGLAPEQLTVFAIWGLGVLAVLRFIFDVLQISGVAVAGIAVLIVIGSFYGIFLPLWRRLPESWRH